MMKLTNKLREKLEKKDYLLGAFVASCAPQNVEILAMNGLDFAILDMEHSPLGLENMVDMIRAAECYDMIAFPRVYTMETKLMRRVLDIGAHGIMLPMVNTPEEAKYIIDAVKFPPLGVRGMNSGRGPRWGAYPNYISEANDALFTIFQCETKQSVDNIDAIAAQPGCDCIFIGTGDLSLDMGHPGELDNPEIVAAIDKVLSACTKYNRIPGIVTSSPESAAIRIKQGFKIVTIMNDLGIFRSATLKQINKTQSLVSSGSSEK